MAVLLLGLFISRGKFRSMPLTLYIKISKCLMGEMFDAYFCHYNYYVYVMFLLFVKDYWISWLHKQLVGRLVFNVTVAASGEVNATRVYAHCTNTDR